MRERYKSEPGTNHKQRTKQGGRIGTPSNDPTPYQPWMPRADTRGAHRTTHQAAAGDQNACGTRGHLAFIIGRPPAGENCVGVMQELCKSGEAYFKAADELSSNTMGQRSTKGENDARSSGMASANDNHSKSSRSDRSQVDRPPASVRAEREARRGDSVELGARRAAGGGWVAMGRASGHIYEREPQAGGA